VLDLLKKQRAALFALLFRLFSAGILFGLAVLLARTLGPEQFGVYSFVFALMQVSVIIGRGGLPNILVRDVAVSRAKGDIGLARSYLRLGWIVATPMALLMAMVYGVILLLQLTGDMPVPHGAALGGMVYIAAMTLVGMLEAGLRGSGRILLGQIAELLIRPSIQLLIFACGALGITHLAPDANLALGAAMIAGFFALCFTLIAYFRATNILDPVPFSDTQPALLRGLLAMSGTLWIAAINSQLNLILLGVIGGEADVGTFQIAAQLTMLMTLGLMAVNSSMAPEMSRLMVSTEEGDARRLQKLSSRSCEISLAFGLPLGVIYLLFGSQLIPLIFSTPFSGAYWPTVILALGQLLNIGFGSVATLLYSNHQEGVVFRAVIMAMIANVLLCLLLIPAYGAIGSALASAVSLGIWNGITFVRLRAAKGIVSLPLVTEWRAMIAR
jgi:O-antigen/teichoic acid export membrane protein